MTKRTFTPEQDKEVVNLYSQGLSTHKIAKRFNCDKSAVSNALERSGINRRDNRGLTDAEEEQIVKIYYAGYAPRRIAKAYGKSEGLIKGALKRQQAKKFKDFRFNFCEAEEQQIAKIYQAGHPISKIARVYQCLHKTIRQALIRQQVKLRILNPKAPYVKRQRKPSKYIINNPTAFDNLDNEQSLYWLGFCYADSDIRDNNLRLGLSQKDRIQLERLIIFLGGKLENIRDGNTSCSINFADKHLVCRLTELGIIVRRGEFWRIAKQIPEGLEHHFIRGYLDGDGCISNREKVIFLGQEDILLWIKSCMIKYTGASDRVLPYQRRGIKEIAWGGSYQFKKIVDYIYQDATIFMQRKKEIADKTKRA